MLLLTHIAITLFSAIVVFCIIYYLILLWESNGYSEDKEAIYVIKIVEALVNVCPIGPCNQWMLLDCILPRCWERSSPLKFWGCISKIFGSCVIVNDSTLATFNMIENPKNWSQWIPDAAMKGSRPLKDTIFREDDYMNCMEMVSKTNDVEWFRFSHFATNNFGWILMWNIKKIDWWCFFLQPICKNELKSCLMTCISGSTSSSCAVKQLPYFVNTIKEAVEINGAYAVPFHNHPLHASEHIVGSSSSDNSNGNESGSCSPSGKEKKIKSTVKILKLVPHFRRWRPYGRKLTSFKLESSTIIEKGLCIDFPKKLRKKVSSESVSQLSEERTTGRLRETSCGTKRESRVSSRTNLYTQNQRRSKSFADVSGRERTRRSRTFNITMRAKSENPLPLRSRWLSDTNLHLKQSSSGRNVSSLENLPEEGRDEEKELNDKPSESNCCAGQNASDFEILLPKVELTDHRKADMLTRGSYCASQLQAEMLEASQVDSELRTEEQSSSCGFFPVTKGLLFCQKFPVVAL